MGYQCLMEVIHHLALLQSQGLHHGQHPLRKAASRITVIAKRVLPPQHPGTQQPLDVVVRRLHPPPSRTATTPGTTPARCCRTWPPSRRRSRDPAPGPLGGPESPVPDPFAAPRATPVAGGSPTTTGRG